MNPRKVVEKWIKAFNSFDIEMLGSLYDENAVNHQMPNHPVIGRSKITEMFKMEFADSPEMHCIPVQIISEGEWAVLEWKDPKGFRGCGFFQIKNDLIVVQRGYWDKLSFHKLYNIPFSPEE